MRPRTRSSSSCSTSRGPQGTLYGRNTTAGAIKYFSNGPTDHFSIDGTARYGNLDDRFGELAISGPIAGNVLTARVAATGEERDGNTLNRVTGKHSGNDIRNWAARGLLKFEPSADFKAVLNVHGGESDPHTVVYKPRGTLTLAGAPCPEADAVAFRCYDALGYRDNARPYSVANNRVGRDRVRTIGANLQAEKDFGWAKLTSITAYDRVRVNRAEDSDGSPNQLLEITYASTSNQFSQELRLASPGGQRFNWIVGGYYFYEKVHFDNQYDILRSLRPFLGFDPAAFVVFADQNFRQRDKAIAGFGRADFAITEKLKVIGGLRYTHERKTFAETVTLPEPAFTIPLYTVGNGQSVGRVTGDAILNYQATDDLLLYASVSRGFKSGGFNGGIVFDPRQVTSFRPETLTSYETGIKFQSADHRLTFNASGFYYDYKDLQVYTIVNPPGGGIPIQVLDNASNARVYGLEAAATFKLLPALRLNGSLGLLNSKFKDFVAAAANADYSGNRLSRAPKITAAVGADLDVPIGDRYRGFANLDASYRSKIFFDPGNSLRLSQSGYWLANARAGIGTRDGHWDVAVFGKNIFGKHYYRDIIDLSLFGYDGTTIGDPATYGVELSFHF